MLLETKEIIEGNPIFNLEANNLGFGFYTVPINLIGLRSLIHMI